jgi:HrpA-like RNA helicase
MDPLSLPIYAAESDIVRALTDHRVLVLQGPTGSGKTTQLPKMLQRAMVTDKIIGVTQPRRRRSRRCLWWLFATC